MSVSIFRARVSVSIFRRSVSTYYKLQIYISLVAKNADGHGITRAFGARLRGPSGLAARFARSGETLRGEPEDGLGFWSSYPGPLPGAA